MMSSILGWVDYRIWQGPRCTPTMMYIILIIVVVSRNLVHLGTFFWSWTLLVLLPDYLSCSWLFPFSTDIRRLTQVFQQLAFGSFSPGQKKNKNKIWPSTSWPINTCIDSPIVNPCRHGPLSQNLIVSCFKHVIYETPAFVESYQSYYS